MEIIKKTVSIFVLLSISTNFGFCKCRNNKEDVMIKACEQYVLSYKPLYYNDKDTFVVARFNTVPDSINTFLIDCARNNDFRALKYSYALILRHNAEYIKKHKTDYIIGDGLILYQNGFIILLRKAMNIGYTDDSFGLEDYLSYNTGEVGLWFNEKNKSIVEDPFIKKYRRKLRRYY